ncbi:MAG: hypothetical protein R3B96_22280 [Pirellulaceae bacterium]
MKACDFSTILIVETELEAAAAAEANLAIDQQVTIYTDRNQRLLSRVRERLRAAEVADDELTDERLRLEADETERERLAKNEQRIAELESRRPSRRRAMLIQESAADIASTFVLYQGDHRQPRAEVGPGLPTMFAPGFLNRGRPREARRAPDGVGTVDHERRESVDRSSPGQSSLAIVFWNGPC